jgi:hypothetical protein
VGLIGDESIEDFVGVKRHNACGFKGLEYSLFDKSAHLCSPEETKEVTFLDREQALSVVKVLSKLL